jgi:hypothetical protein
MSDNNKCIPDTISIDGVVYSRKDSTPPPTGKRAVLVMDRGWIICADLEYKEGRIYATRVIHIRKWESVGFDGMVKDPTSLKVKPFLFTLPNCDMPQEVELFKVPVCDNWGL